jgi:hypothetical protein
MITKGNVARLLALMAAYDNRTIGEADVLAWFNIMPVNIGYERAIEAVKLYYQQNTTPIMPAQLIQYAKLVSLNPPPPPEDTSDHITIQQYGVERFWAEVDAARAENGHPPLNRKGRRGLAHIAKT